MLTCGQVNPCFIGNEGLQDYVADVKASNKPSGPHSKADKSAIGAQDGPVTSAFAIAANDRSSFESNMSPVSITQPEDLVIAESLSGELSLAQAQAQRATGSSLEEAAPRGGKVTLPPLPPGVVPRNRAASTSGVNVSVLDGLDSDPLPPKQMHQVSLPGSTGAPASDQGPQPLPLDASTSTAALESAPSAEPSGKTFKQMNANKPKGTAKRAQFGSMYMPAAHSSINRPTYATEAVDEDNADAKASGIFSV